MNRAVRIIILLVAGALCLSTFSVKAQNSGLIIGNYTLVSTQRINRTVFDYTYKASITNGGSQTLKNVTATLASTFSPTSVIDGTLNFGDVPAGGMVISTDTFTIRQDRLYPCDISALKWDIQYGETLGPSGGTFNGDNGVSISVPPGATDQSVKITINSVQENNLGKPIPPGFSFLGAVKLDIGDVILTINADIAIPTPVGVPDNAEIYLAQLISFSGVNLYQMVDTASVQGGKIVSNAPGFPGVIQSGTYVFLWGNSVGWIGGKVTRKDTGASVPKAVVTLSGGYFLNIADNNGNYKLAAWAGSFVVVAFDDQTSDFGEKQGFMPSNGASVTVNVAISGASGPLQNTLTNGGFETGNLNGWFVTGEASVITSLGPIKPDVGNYMAMISTGGAAVGGASSGLEQTFKVPQGATTLTLRYNFVSEEYPEFVGSQYNDAFNATLHTPSGSIQVAFESVNTAKWMSVSGIDFPGGDNTCGQTGWLTASIDVSKWAGTNDTLTLTVHDVGDTIYDSVVLLDSIKLGERVLEMDADPVNGNIAAAGDIVEYRFTAEFKSKYTLETDVPLWGGVNTIIELRDISGTLLQSDDDSGSLFASRIDRDLDPGIYYVTVKGKGNSTGNYSVGVRPFAVETRTFVLAFENVSDSGVVNAAKAMGNRLYDATEGQIRLKELQVKTNKTELWAIAFAHAFVQSQPLPLNQAGDTDYLFAQLIYIDYSHNEGNGGDKVLVHEYGHFGLTYFPGGADLRDEYGWYQDVASFNIPNIGNQSQVHIIWGSNFVEYFYGPNQTPYVLWSWDVGYDNPTPANTCGCIMNDHIHFSEFCWSGNHVTGRNEQALKRKKSCWDCIKGAIPAITLPTADPKSGPCPPGEGSNACVAKYVIQN